MSIPVPPSSSSSSSFPASSCPICLEPLSLSNLLTFPCRKHKVHRHCALSYIKHCLSKRLVPIPCPAFPFDGFHLKDVQVYGCLSKEEEQEQYKRVKEERRVATTKGLVFCPTPGCNTVLEVEEEEGEGEEEEQEGSVTTTISSSTTTTTTTSTLITCSSISSSSSSTSSTSIVRTGSSSNNNNNNNQTETSTRQLPIVQPTLPPPFPPFRLGPTTPFDGPCHELPSLSSMLHLHFR
ncbi:hypothetical protein VYU27_009162 [Nannochloropsis oceanica]